MSCNQYPSNSFIGNIVIHTSNLPLARRVAEIARAEIVERQVTSGVANVEGHQISWAVLSQFITGNHG